MARPSLPAIRRQILVARRSLAALDRSLKRLAGALRAFPATGKRTRRSVKLSRKVLAALKLQGQYMGYIRQLKPMHKTLVRAVLAKSGKKAAIRRAQELAGKGKTA